MARRKPITSKTKAAAPSRKSNGSRRPKKTTQLSWYQKFLHTYYSWQKKSAQVVLQLENEILTEVKALCNHPFFHGTHLSQNYAESEREGIQTVRSWLTGYSFTQPEYVSIAVSKVQGTIFTAPVAKRWHHLKKQQLKKWQKFAKKRRKIIAQRWKKTKQNLPQPNISPVTTVTTQLGSSIASSAQSMIRQLGQALATIFKWPWLAIKFLTKPFIDVARYYPWQTAVSIFSTILIMGGSYVLYDFVFKDLPTALALEQHTPIVSTKILDRHGNLLYNIYKDENRTVISISEIPPHVINATISVEDQNFWHHHGFDIQGIARAAIANAQGKPVQGGSTITQQLVKNTVLDSERSLQRKVRELLVAVTVEANFSKTEILEKYFNEIPYGGSTYGVEEAAQRFFGKHARELTLAESAMLAGLPAAPTAYSPFGPTPELAYARQAEVLRRMVEEGYISEEEAAAARKEVLQFKNNSVDIQAPHFVMYVRQQLVDQYGEEVLNQEGLEVVTTLDLEIQRLAEQAVRDEVGKLTNMRVSNGAAIVTDPETGEVLAMVGSIDYFDFENDGQVNVTLRPRQPGSSIKPLTYALAFERGDNPGTIITDAPITYNIPGSPPYSPRNYDGKFHGKVTLREALASSYNIPAVKLLSKVGVGTMIDKAKAIGIGTWSDRKRFGLSLTLGGGEVRMIDMAQLYGTFANDGVTVSVNPILQITKYDGSTLYRNDCVLDETTCPGKRNFDPRIAAQITSVLSDNIARSPAFGTQSVLNIPGQQVAVKTGTTNNLKDNWTDGYTSDYVVIAWVGNNDNTPMSYVASGITGASPIWNTIMRGLLDEENPHAFAVPDGLVEVEICAVTGTLPCRGCPVIRKELFTAGTEPTQACSPSYFRPKPSPSPEL